MRKLLLLCGLVCCSLSNSDASGQDYQALAGNYSFFSPPEVLNASDNNDFKFSKSMVPPQRTQFQSATDEKNSDRNFSPFPSVKITGFFQLDTGYYLQDEMNQLTLGDIEDGLGFRRARLGAKGNVTEDVSYILEFDIAQNQARFVDVWMQVDKTRFGNVRIGRFRQPFGMSELTSVRELPFLERPLTFTESPFRQTGVMFFDHTVDERSTWAVSGYRTLSDNFGNLFSDSGGYGMATRLTRILQNWGDNHLWHLGLDYSFNDPGRGVIQFASTNELFVGQNPNVGPAGLSVLPIVGVPPFVNSGQITAHSAQFFNVESAIALGRMAVQSEARWIRVAQTAGGSVNFPGAYIQVRYMLTGESISYHKKTGVFGRVKPASNFEKCSGTGAWELLGRVSHIDLNDAGTNGRRLTDYTIGCNWYWNTNAKIQFNWIYSDLSDPTLGSSQANAFAMRAQLDF